MLAGVLLYAANDIVLGTLEPNKHGITWNLSGSAYVASFGGGETNPPRYALQFYAAECVRGSNAAFETTAGLSIMCWMYYTNAQNATILKIGDTGESVANGGNADNFGYGFGIGNNNETDVGNHLIGDIGAVEWDNTVTDLAYGEWMHLGMTINAAGTTRIYYRNGIEIFRVTGSAGYAPHPRVYIGGNYGNNWNFRGKIDEVLVFTNCVASNDIVSIFNNGYTTNGVYTNVYGFWHLDEGTGTNVYDSYTSKWAHVIYGTPLWTNGCPAATH